MHITCMSNLCAHIDIYMYTIATHGIVAIDNIVQVGICNSDVISVGTNSFMYG